MNDIRFACLVIVALASAGCVVDSVSTPDEESSAATTSQALVTGCKESAASDLVSCAYLYGTSGSAFANGLASCKVSYTNAQAACDAGAPRIYRWIRSLHRETRVYSGGGVEDSYQFAVSPQPGASATPIHRCYVGGVRTADDFPSSDPNCEGQGAAPSIHGYSYAPGAPGAFPVYRCRVGGDHFMSRAGNCEGQVVESLVGYAK